MRDKDMASEVAVLKKGRITIPARLRKKFKIEEGTLLEAVATPEGILFKRKQSIWDLFGSGAPYATVEEVKKELDKLREEDM
jgi:AbrB family looped-hinge helix DNA binding protein